MNDDESRWEVVRRAWRAGAASDEEVQSGAARVKRALAESRQLPVRPWRRAAVAVVLTVFAATLAYAANRAARAPAPLPPLPEDSASEGSLSGPLPSRPLPRLGPGGGPQESERQATPGAGSRGPAVPWRSPHSTATPSSASAQAALPGAVASAAGMDLEAAARRGSWKRVDEALGRQDTAAAERELARLAASADPPTRAKATLGLAQLAAGRGDCARVRKLVLGLALVPGSPPGLLARARRLAMDCE